LIFHSAILYQKFGLNALVLRIFPFRDRTRLENLINYFYSDILIWCNFQDMLPFRRKNPYYFHRLPPVGPEEKIRICRKRIYEIF